MIPERIGFRWGVSPAYSLLLVVDAILSIALVVAGVGLVRGKVWGSPAALSASGAVLVNTLGLGFLIWGPELLLSKPLGSYVHGVLAPRYLFYVLAICILPYVLGVFLKASVPSSPTLRSRWTCLLGSALVSGLMVGVIEIVRRGVMG